MSIERRCPVCEFHCACSGPATHALTRSDENSSAHGVLLGTTVHSRAMFEMRLVVRLRGSLALTIAGRLLDGGAGRFGVADRDALNVDEFVDAEG